MDIYRDSLACCIAMVLGLGGCFFDSGGVASKDGSVVESDGAVDATGPGQDGSPDAPPGTDAPPALPAHVLITEVALTSGEFIEIFNPGAQEVDLTDYYLADNSGYARLPGLTGDSGGPAIGQYDFIARFPDGATIGPGAVKVIAVDSDGFTDAYSQAPDFTIFGDGAPRMRDPDSLIDEETTLTNTGEGIVLFYWDGASDLVADVDMVHAGTIDTASNRLGEKDGLEVDGPDPGPNTDVYKDDAYTLGFIDGNAGGGFSHKRITLEDGHELRDVGGNGLLGDDETSENLSMTWDDSSSFTPSTPGTVPASLTGG